jgi:transcriptional regulator with XRE-family HTH domain/tetratricopeptide (TPR) repeat protein
VSVTERPALSFAGLLRQLRTESGLTQEELAQAAGLSPRSVSDLERGVNRTARKDTARLLADALSLAGPQRALFEAAARGRAPAAQAVDAQPLTEPRPATAPELPRQSGSPGPQQRLIPRQLPAAVPMFVGRAEELAALIETLCGPGSGAPVVVATTGMGGVGKTTLAVRAAHAASGCYPDGQLYVDLRGAGDDPVDPADALTTMLRALEVAVPAQAGSGELAALFRSITADRRILVLLDNAANAAQVGPLMPGTAGSAVVVTSRQVLPELAADRAVEVGVFDETQAVELLGAVVGAARVDGDRQAAAEVATLCAGLPLALRIAGARLAGRPAWTMRSLADRLTDRRRRLGELRAGELAVASVFELAYAQLDAEQARMFRLIGAVETPDLSLAALSAIAHRPPAETEAVAESLIDAGMVQSPSPGRYRLHDLLQLFAVDRATDPTETRQALADLLAFFVATMRECHVLGHVKGAFWLSALRAAPDAPKLRLGSDEQAAQWAVQELPVIMAVLSRLATPRPEADQELLDLAADCLLGLSAITPSNSQRELHTVAPGLAQAAGNNDSRTRINLAHLRELLASSQTAKARELLPATVSVVQTDDVLALMHLSIAAHIEFWFGQYAAALTAALADADLAGRLGDLRHQANALHFASRIRSAQGDPAAALLTWQQAREVDPNPDQNIYGTAALIHAQMGLGRYEEAQAECQRLAQQFRDAGESGMVHTAMRGEAEILRRAGRPQEALDLAEKSRTIAEQLGDDLDQARALAVMGLALADLGRPGEARVCTQRAATFIAATGLPTDIPSLYVH